MPVRDGTGPSGMGPMTGKGFGNCVGGMGMGRGRGRGMGLGRRCGFGGYQNLTKEQESAMLKDTAEELQSSLDSVKKRIEELDKSQS